MLFVFPVFEHKIKQLYSIFAVLFITNSVHYFKKSLKVQKSAINKEIKSTVQMTGEEKYNVCRSIETAITAVTRRHLTIFSIVLHDCYYFIIFAQKYLMTTKQNKSK